MSKLHCIRLVTALAALALGAGLQSKAQAATFKPDPNAPFRVGMQLGYGPHTPKSPPPPAGTSQWNDVELWQRFLTREGHPLHPGYSNNVFDKSTEKATKDYQVSYQLPATGTVNWATYHRAFGKGKHPHAVPPPRTAFVSRAGCHIRFPMGSGCRDLGEYRDVSAWQSFLIDMGYLGAGYPNGVFDHNTRVATIRFEADSGLNVTGIVEMYVIRAAERTGHFSCKPIHIPCPHGHEVPLRKTERY